MEALNHLIKLIGSDDLKVLNYDLLVPQSDAFRVFQKLNKEIGKITNTLESLLRKDFNKNCSETKHLIPKNANHKEVQTDMLGLLHPNGEFVNIYHGKINNITVDCDNLDEAVHTYNTQQKRHIDTKALPESPKENSIADESYTVNKNHKKLVPPASLGNRNTNDNEKNKCFNSIRENDKMYNICNTDPIKTKSYNTCAKFTIDNNSFRTPRTLKCGQKIIISRSKLTPLPKVTVNNDPSLFLKQFKNDLPIDDNVSVTSSSLDVNELDEFLINDNGTFEKYMEISEKAEVTKNDKNRSLVAENFFKCWKFCDVLDNKGYA